MMTRPLTLYLPQAIFEALHKAADGKGKKTMVAKADLTALLMDHANALARLADLNVPLAEGYAISQQVRKHRGEG